MPAGVLFACGLNRIRSPMAEGVAHWLHGPRLKVESCGLTVDLDALPDPFVATVMDEIGVDVSAREPKSFDDLDPRDFGVIVSLSPEAQHRAVEFARDRPIKLEYWPTQDPTLTQGSRETILGAYREVRHALEARIRERFPPVRTFGG
ncbi:MAG TPA: low molecular weight phosphatase family protein [Caulobacteraceae bacterium]|jgi:protein-tyrosine-phosphatase